MKATLEFNLPDDQEEYKIVSRALDMYHVVHELDQELRAKAKYSEEPENIITVYVEIRELLHRLLNEHNVSL